jgi:hypothetical protein
MENIQFRIDEIILSIDPSGQLLPETEKVLRKQLGDEGYSSLDIDFAIRHYNGL